MNYLYGDSTPFPLEENFLETLVGLTKVAVGLLQAEAAIVSAKQQLELLAEEAEREDQRLQALQKTLLATIEQQDSQKSRLLAETAKALAQASSEVIERARGNIARLQQATGRDLQATIETQRTAIPQILEQFLLEQALPKTSWALSWRLELGKTPRTAARALALSPCGVDALFQLNLPVEHRWAQPLKVGDLLAQVGLLLPRGRRLLSGANRTENVALGRYYITAVELSLGRQSLVLQRKPKEDTQGFELTWQSESAELLVQPFGKTGKLENSIALTADDAPGIEPLFAAIAKDLRPLISRRRVLKNATFNEVSVAELESPAELALVLIDSVAPLVQEIAARSSSASELALKRDLGGRRREELFVPVAELTDRINTLPEDYRRCFASFGLPLQQTSARIVEPSPDEPATARAAEPAAAGAEETPDEETSSVAAEGA